VRTYETIFILDPDMSDEDIEKSLAKIQDTITSQNGTIALIERWGKRKLAYRVRKKTKGNYFRLVYYSDHRGSLQVHHRQARGQGNGSRLPADEHRRRIQKR